MIILEIVTLLLIIIVFKEFHMTIHPLHTKIQEHLKTLCLANDSTACEVENFKLFLQVSKYQRENNLGLKNYLETEYGKQAQHLKKNINCINELPTLPTDAFKHSVNPSTLSPDNITKTFLTSGTTTEIKGSHHFATTSTYETSILTAWQYCKLPSFNETFFLTPSTQESPHSSLSHMMETLKHNLIPEASYLLVNGVIDHQAILDCATNNRPVSILGTALAFLELFRILEQEGNIQLPTGSWALETGGYKGSKESLSKEELYDKFQIHLGIAPDHIWNEYSMTELSSQFYTHGLNKPHIGPPWAPIKVINPETNLPVKPGGIGYLVIYDLANIDSTVGIRTQDLAVYHNPHSFTLIGRDPSALPRGCSRSI